MFGSNDDKNTPAPAAPASAEKPAERKDLFGWLRKKPQAPSSPEPQPTPVSEQPAAPAVAETEPAPVAPVSEVAAPVESPVIPAEVVVEPQPASVVPVPVEPTVAPALPEASEANPQPRPSRFRINAGSEVLHAHIEQPALVEPVVAPPVIEPAVVQPVAVPAKNAEETRAGFLERLKQGLSKTSASLGEGMASLFLGKKAIDDDLLEDLETRLLTADVGVEATTAIIGNLTKRVARKELADSGALYKALQDELTALLKPVEQPLKIDSSKQPYVILVVGVNGAGKTTTIGKLAKKLQQDGKKVMLAAGDTFRAAAVEQLQVWGERNQIAVIAQHTGADSASVIFDAVQAAKSRGMDVLIADTAGRLHTKDNLMEELKKVRRVIGKLDDTAPHEVLLVLDAGTGQNAINQAKQFNQTVNLTGLALTKLDGTAKGGVIFALAKQFALPIRYIGVGEGIDDLRTFEADAFVQALFAEK
ncbi:signal recognition particle-docking protein FtsY [Pseudomonas anguilliseptica]|uniref:signal recognition particle-docking protein FtsY n=1 Tax=Pseudomonas anguilliseptica TaxID=53406 RepID=UPI0022AFAC62|nr:signal recognition particle-docking protein FtsY [Pseudomonas anguilliseptica]MCZ4320754.1 signal recognition particle-docking protein FtsY [Pseudomonas anguilliseptica]